MTTIVHDADATLDPIRGARTAVVGYGNQGRPWALNLRDSGVDVTVCVRADETQERATADGFTTTELDAASEFDVLCILIPDDVIPSLPMFLLVPAMLRGGVAFWPALVVGCFVTFVLYLLTAWVAARFGIQL